MPIVASIDVSALRGTKVFQALWPAMQEKMKSFGDVLASMKSACAFDPAAQIDSLVVAGSDEGDDTAAVVMAFKMAQADIEKCFVKAMKAGGNDVKIGKDGAFSKYAVGDNAAYARWVDKNTVAVAIRAADKDFLTKMTAGGIAKDKGLAGVKVDSAVWVLINKPSDVDPLGAKMQRAYGSADVKSGTIAANVHFVLDSADVATSAAKKVQGQLDVAKASGQIPAALDWVFKSVQVSALGTEMVINASGTEQNVLDLIKVATQ
jgi:hypothetical protein